MVNLQKEIKMAGNSHISYPKTYIQPVETKATAKLEAEVKEDLKVETPKEPEKVIAKNIAKPTVTIPVAVDVEVKSVSVVPKEEDKKA